MGNRIVSLTALTCRYAVTCLVCPECESPLCLAEDASVRRGLVSHLAFRCTLSTWSVCTCTSDPAAPRSVAMNAKSVLGSRFCGWGRSGIESMCAILDIPPPHSGYSFVAYS